MVRARGWYVSSTFASSKKAFRALKFLKINFSLLSLGDEISTIMSIFARNLQNIAIFCMQNCNVVRIADILQELVIGEQKCYLVKALECTPIQTWPKNATNMMRPPATVDMPPPNKHITWHSWHSRPIVISTSKPTNRRILHCLPFVSAETYFIFSSWKAFRLFPILAITKSIQKLKYENSNSKSEL